MKQSFRKFFTSSILVVGASMLIVTTLPGCALLEMRDQKVVFIEPADGAVVASTFKVRFGLKGMTIAPAGAIVQDSGHHHLMIERDSIAEGEAIPFNEKHLHFSNGQTEAELKLPPGVYRLTMQFSNGAHQSYGKALSETITVTVK
jgi:hypothetical protein